MSNQNRRNHYVPPVLAAMAAQQQPQAQPAAPVKIAQPLNDAQMLCLMAVHCPGESPAEKVRQALEIAAESVAAIACGEMDRLIAARKALRQSERNGFGG